LPSYREGFGSIIVDAAGVGIPSIGSNIYGISDAIDNGRTGILHKAGDIDEIFNSMLKLATNSNLRKAMGDAAKIRVQDNYSIEIITKAWVDEYNFTLG
jgi:glycosyltransferase involved in cell wall biosynthesis